MSKIISNPLLKPDPQISKQEILSLIPDAQRSPFQRKEFFEVISPGKTQHTEPVEDLGDDDEYPEENKF